jgi:ribosome-interacting GTPase 1
VVFLFPVARTCNLILIVLDVLKPLGHKKLIEHELEGFGIRLNKKPPNIGFKKKDKGGINFTVTVRLFNTSLSRPAQPVPISLSLHSSLSLEVVSSFIPLI